MSEMTKDQLEAMRYGNLSFAEFSEMKALAREGLRLRGGLPDIGTDPLQHNSPKEYRSIESVKARLMQAMSVQQKGVPDQTALVWRIDISDLHGRHTWRQAGHILALAEISTLTAELDSLRKELSLLKLRNVFDGIKNVCSTCGHTETEDGCAYCIKQNMAMELSCKNCGLVGPAHDLIVHDCQKEKSV